MLEFLRRNRILLTTGLFLALAAGLVVRTSAVRYRSDPLSRLFLDAVVPLQRASSLVRETLAGGWRTLADLMRARTELVALRTRNRELEQQAVRMGEAELENARLKRLLDFRDTLTGDVIAARVVGRDATGLSRTITIDRGEANGVRKGAAVIVPEGTVGQIFLVSHHAARVLLISDHNSGVDAFVQRSRARGIVEGTVDGGCGLKFLKRTEDVQVGDLVVTSGLDGIFPKGLPVGRVTAVDKRGQGLFQYAEITPNADFDRLEEILVTRGPVEMVSPEE